MTPRGLLVTGVAAALLTTAPAPVLAQLPPAPSYDIRAAAGPITLDGALDEPDWSRAEAIPLSWETAPGDNTPAPVETVCRMTFDVTNLYFGCVATDPDPTRIRAHLAERDDRIRTIQDDHIVFLLDPFNDERRGFEFRVNTLGVQMDAILARSEGIEDFSWDAVWYSEVRHTDSGYVVEVAIPFGSLRFPQNHEVQTWGLVIDRSYPRNVRTRMRSAPTDRNTTCLLCGANKITGFQGMVPGGSVEAVPTMTAIRTDVRAPSPAGTLQPVENTPFADFDPSFGVDMRWGITTALSLNGMVNPDFSQVEADVAQLAENRRFALFFPETRPFFLEGADFFNTPIQAVFTRSVADPDGGIKLTGKEGPHAIGFFAARDASTNLLFPANQGSTPGAIAGSSTNAVARYRRDVGAASYVGGLVTARGEGGYRNVVAGADGFHRLDPSNTIRFQILRSSTEYPLATATTFGQPQSSFSGTGLLAQYTHNSRDWIASVSYNGLDPDFRADAGFIPRVDARIVQASAGRIFSGSADSWFTRLQAGAFLSRTTDFNGTLTDQTLGAQFDYAGPSQSTVRISPQRRKLLFGGTEHDLNRLEGQFEVRPSGSFTFGSVVRTGQFVDFANNRKSFGLVLTPQAQLYVGQNLALTVGHTHQRLRFQGDKVYTANLTQGRVLYHFNVRSFVRAVVQYRLIDRDPTMYLNPVRAETTRLLTQLLFSYQVNPQTAFFVGYADRHDGDDLVELSQNSRTFFVKVGYAIHP